MIAINRAGLAILCVLSLGATSPGAGAAQANCRDDRVEIRSDAGVQRFRVELADTAAERARGLMFRKEMPTGAGMLFVYPEPQLSTNFWMQNTLIPLDIIYMDATGTVKTIQPMAKPLDTTPLPGGPGIQYVLEINGGLAERMGIAPGDVLRHPVIPTPLAAWPCDAEPAEGIAGSTGDGNDALPSAPMTEPGAEPVITLPEGPAKGAETVPAERQLPAEEPPVEAPPPLPQVESTPLPLQEN